MHAVMGESGQWWVKADESIYFDFTLLLNRERTCFVEKFARQVLLLAFL